MLQVIMEPKLYKFDTCKEFAEGFSVGLGDLILTNRYIYDPCFSRLGLNAQVIFQEEYGSGEPTDIMTERMMKDAAKLSYKRIIAIGGGTIIDIAKAMSVADGDESMDVLYNRMSDLTKRYELIIIPTTCGTGSEVTNIAVFNRTRMGTKMGLVGPALYADKAVLIPELLYTLPFHVFATSSIDALVHAVESVLSPKATAYTKLFSYKAIEMIIRGYQKLREEGREALTSLLDDFLTASNFAGIAFGTAGCGLVHAMAYPLGGECHIAHGESNYALFIDVMKKYAALRKDGEMAVLNKMLSELLGCEEASVYEELEALLNVIFARKPLREYGVTEDNLKSFSSSVIENQGRLLANAYVKVDRELVEQIYKESY